MWLNKGTQKIGDNIIGLLIAAAGVFILLTLLFVIFSPTYNAEAKTAESYLGMFNEKISSVDSGIDGSLTFWGGSEGKVKYYLAYFGSKSVFEKEGLTFVTCKRNENAICVCYGDENKIHCDDCRELDLPVEYSESAPWIINSVKQLKITKEGGKYLFSK